MVNESLINDQLDHELGSFVRSQVTELEEAFGYCTMSIVGVFEDLSDLQRSHTNEIADDDDLFERVSELHDMLYPLVESICGGETYA